MTQEHGLIRKERKIAAPVSSWEAFEKTYRTSFASAEHSLDWSYLEARAEEIRAHEEALGSMRPLFEKEADVDAAEDAQYLADLAKDVFRAEKAEEAKRSTAFQEALTGFRTAEEREKDARQYFIGALTDEDPGYPEALLQVDPYTEQRKAWDAFASTQRAEWIKAKKAAEASEVAFNTAKEAYHTSLQPALDRWHATKAEIRDTWKSLGKEAEARLLKTQKETEARAESDADFLALRNEQREQMSEHVTALFHAETAFHKVEALLVETIPPNPPIEDLKDVVDIFRKSLETQEGEALSVIIEKCLEAVNAVYPIDALKSWASGERDTKDPRVKDYFDEKDRLKGILSAKVQHQRDIEEALYERRLHYREVHKHPDYLAAEAEAEAASEALYQKIPPPPPIAKELETFSREADFLFKPIERALERLRKKPFEQMLETVQAIRDRLLVPEEREKYAETYAEEVLDARFRREGFDEVVRTHKKELWRRALTDHASLTRAEYDQFSGRLSPYLALERTVESIAFETAFEDLYQLFETAQKEDLPPNAQADLKRNLPIEWSICGSYRDHGDNANFKRVHMGARWDERAENISESLAQQVLGKRPRRTLIDNTDPEIVLTLQRHHDLAAIANPEMALLFSRDAQIGYEDGPTARAFFEGYGTEMKTDPSFISSVETVAREMQKIQHAETRTALETAGKQKLTRADLVILDELLKTKDEDLIGLYCYAMSSRQGEDTPIDPSEDLVHMRRLRACGLTCKKNYSPFIGSFSPQYGIRELIKQPPEIQERWARALLRVEQTHLADDFSHTTDKIRDRPQYIEDLAARVEWTECALEVQTEGSKEAVTAYACLNMATFAEAKTTALLLVKEGCLIPEGAEQLGMINWVRLMASATSPEMRRDVLAAFQRMRDKQPSEDGPFPIGLAALNAETFLIVDRAMQEEPKGIMEGLGALSLGLNIKSYKNNDRYREEQVVDRRLEGSRRQYVLFAAELLEAKQRGVFQVFCELHRLAPGEARALADAIAHDWTLEETPLLTHAVKQFAERDEELASVLDVPPEKRMTFLRTHAAAFARFPGLEQRIISLGEKEKKNPPKEEEDVFQLLLDERLPKRVLALFIDTNTTGFLRTLPPEDRQTHLERYEDLLNCFPDARAPIGIRIAKALAEKKDVAQEKLLIERTLHLLKEISSEAIDALYKSLDIASIEKLLLESDPNHLGITVRILEKLVRAPSASIQRVRLELAREIAAASDPEAVYEQVVEIFVRNNLPLVGKVFRVFEILHPQEKLDQRLRNPNLSPTLQALGHRERMMVFYKDLLRIHIGSGNRELLQYFQVMSELDSVESCNSVAEVQALPEAKQRQWMNLMRKMSTLLQNSTFGKMHPETGHSLPSDASIETLFERYQNLREDLSLQPGQRVKERLEEMFFRPIGLASVEEAVSFGKQKKQKADERNRALVEASPDGTIAVQAGDMLKGFDHAYFANILQNGSVAKEFLGSSSDSDYTPLDTDLSLITAGDAKGGLRHAIDQSIAKGYGRVLLCVRPKETFRETTVKDDSGTLQKEARARTPEQIEYFKTNVLGERHMGIRTGFSLTDVEFMSYVDEPPDQKTLRNLAMDLVINGFYIPIVNKDGKILFTPQEFDAYREKFCSGLTSLGQPPFEVHAAEPLTDALRSISDEIKENQRSLDEGQAHVTEVVRVVLTELGALSPDQEFLLEDTGSSGRGTGIPGSIDFDFVLKLDPIALQNQGKIHETIAKRLGGTSNGGDTTGQLRLKDVPFQGTKIEVDIAFVPQTEVRLFESHDAVRERLSSIRATSGEEAYEQVQATVVYTKRLLKKAGVYKKAEQGGLGGIGVENWILAHHGNFIEAAKSFVTAAKPDGKTVVPLGTFQDTYPLFDPGVNAKFRGTHDHFGRNLSEKGYALMVATLEAELARLEPPMSA